MVFGTAFFAPEAADWTGETSRTNRMGLLPFAALVVADENADSEFVDSIRRTVTRIC